MARLLASVLLASQAVVWIGGPLVEAKPAAQGFATTSHVEQAGGSNCPWIHSHLDCLICRTIGSGAIGGSTPAAPLVATASSATPAEAVTAPVTGLRASALGARAPPTA